jgi:hypothetical protein
MSEIVKKQTTVLDNFEGWDDSVEGNERPESAGIIQGGLIKFSNEAAWISREGDELPAGLELVPVDVWRLVQKWKDQAPVETIFLEPHQKFPDIEEMNAETPKSEWVEGPDGQLRGPWQGQHVLYLLDPKTMDNGRRGTRSLKCRSMNSFQERTLIHGSSSAVLPSSSVIPMVKES